MNSTYVWDPAVRIFHWLLVISFVIAYMTGDGYSSIHLYAGYTVFGLVIFRIIWGFVGSKHARFKDFVRSPAETMNYLKSLITGKPKHYAGHNPVAGYVFVLMLVVLLIVTISGYLVNSGYSGGIAIGIEDEFEDEYERDEHLYENDEIEEIHEISANVALGLALMHIAAVVIFSFFHNTNYIKAMITGRKEPLW